MGCMNSKGTGDPVSKHNKSNQNKQLERETTTIDYRRITNKYKLTQTVLGAGNFGKVFLATSIADQDFKVAIKTISKKKVQD